MHDQRLVDVIEEVTYIRNVAAARYVDDAVAGGPQRLILGLTTLAICQAEALQAALQARNAPAAWVAYRVLADHGRRITDIAQDGGVREPSACQVAGRPSAGAPDDPAYALASAYLRGEGLAIALGDDLAPFLVADVLPAAAEVLRVHAQALLAGDPVLATLPAVVACMAEIDARLKPPLPP